MFQLKNFIEFYWSAGNLHNLHSPFMFDLARKCLYDRRSYPDYKQLKNYHKSLLQNPKKLKVTDYGAGSKVFKSDKRAVSRMAKVAGSSYADMKRLYRIVKYFQPKHILELGTSLGKATFAMALANPQAAIISVEGDPDLANFAGAFLKKHHIHNVEIIPQKFEAFLPELNRSNQQFDLIFIDGNHRFEPTITYFDLLQKHIHNDTLVIIDDIYWSEEMKKAWETLKQHPSVRQSVDVFYFGLLFFRKEQFKQHFKINLHSWNLF